MHVEVRIQGLGLRMFTVPYNSLRGKIWKSGFEFMSGFLFGLTP